jgi:hypothetical protein
MGAMCDPVYDVTVTCPECGSQEMFCGDSTSSLDRAFLWFYQHMVVSHGNEEDDDGQSE